MRLLALSSALSLALALALPAQAQDAPTLPPSASPAAQPESSSPGWGPDPGAAELEAREAEPDEDEDEREEAVPPPVFDSRVPSGITLGVVGLVMIGAGISNYIDAEGQDTGASLAIGSIVGGTTALLSGTAYLTYAGIEGSDTPRRAHRKVAVGQILTGLGFAYTTMLSISLIHGYYENDDNRFLMYVGHAPAGGIMVAGVPIWLAGARDVEIERGTPTRTVMRSPTMALVGGMMTLTGLAGCGASIRIATEEETFNGEQNALTGTLAAIGGVTTSLGATLLVFGVTDAEIPRNMPELAAGPGSASLRVTFD